MNPEQHQHLVKEYYQWFQNEHTDMTFVDWLATYIPQEDWGKKGVDEVLEPDGRRIQMGREDQ